MDLKKTIVFIVFFLPLYLIADEANLKKMIEALYPKYKVESIKKTSYSGLYEVFMGGQIIYTDDKFSFLIAEGHIVDPKTKKDLTGERLEDLTKIDFSSLPLASAIKTIKGNGARKLVVFADVDCPFCKRLEKNEFTHLNDITIYTFLFPIEKLHPDAKNKSQLIWCAKDKSKAWLDWSLNDTLPSDKTTCEVPTEKNLELGAKLGITSTPTLIFSDGRRMLGAQPFEEIEKMLNSTKS
ncbi:MAG: DsbC family protein [Candidatus Methylopumilus sp.]|nr:DsbC family protein [Candidatus Methylopumilus sp.]